jgi:hypothetical protein
MADQGVIELTVDSRQHCLKLSAAQMDALQQRGASMPLEPGRHILTLQPPSETRAESAKPGFTEPAVIFWIYGGRVINQRTQVPVSATWASLQGYGDSLVLEVLEAATLCALFPPTLDNPVSAGDGLKVSILRP